MIARILKRTAGVLALLALSLTPVATVSAATGTGAASLSMSGGGSYTTGNTFNVTVSTSSSVDIYGVDASFSFDASKLRCNGVNGDGSAFANSYQGTCGNGIVTIGRGTQGNAVRSGKVASVSFTALATGTATFKAVAATEIDDANVANVCNSTCAAGATLSSVTLTAPVEGGRGGDPTPAPTTPAPTTKNTPTNNANNKTATNNSTATTDGEVAGDETKAAETAKTDDKKKDDSKKSDDKKDDEKKTSSSAWFWPVALVAVIAGYVAARTMRSRAAAKAAADAEAAAAAKTASDKPKNKKNKN